MQNTENSRRLLLLSLSTILFFSPTVWVTFSHYSELSENIQEFLFFSTTLSCVSFVVLYLSLYRSLKRAAHDESTLRHYSGELERNYQELQNAKEIAESASKAKSDFLANMSHELRTPLNSIIGMTRLMLESNTLPDDQAELAANTYRSSVNLLDIVNDILDLSKIEAGELTLEHIGFDLHYVLHGVVYALTPLASAKHLRLVRHYEREFFPILAGDPTRLSQILTNLIGNAIKYTDEGRVEIHVECRKIDESKTMLHCQITDTGIGVAPEKIHAIFDKFVQADTSTTRRYGGTGLGLTITKQLTELMGGTIGLKSVVGQGSTFWFSIPFAFADSLGKAIFLKTPVQRHGTIPPEQARVLIVEDHPVNQLLVSKLMQRISIGMHAIANNGKEALTLYHSQEWDLILMDCHMPEMNGYEATEHIRAIEANSGKHVPIIAMTANAMVGDREKCIACGMDDYVSKPLDIEKLYDTMNQWIELSPLPKSSPTPAGGPAVLKLSQLNTVSDGDKQLQKQLIDLFILQAEQSLVILENQCVEGQSVEWAETAHLLKGSAGNIGAVQLQKLCAQAQRLTNASRTERQELYGQIMQAYKALLDECEKQQLL